MKEKFLFRHFVQIVFAVCLASLLAYIPYALREGDPSQSSLAITVFLVFVLVFEINNAMQKHRELKRNVNLELSRIRRVHHLAQKMSTRKTKWKTSVDVAVKAYLIFFRRHSFSDYIAASKYFREVTSLVYEYKPKTAREDILFRELLETTRELAAMRQNISAQIKQRISMYQWVVVLIITLLVIVSALLTQGSDITAFFLNLSLLSAIFIAIQLIWEVDDYNKDELRQFADLYVENKKLL